MTRVFIDTGAFVAIRRPDEREHQRARQTFAALVERRVRLISTNYVFAETYSVLLSRVSSAAALAWGAPMRSGSGIEFARVDAELEDAAWAIVESHDDQDWTYVDAVSFALMERDRISTAFAFDDHFRQRGLAVVPALD